jgi:hypothetical protein
MKSIIFIFIVFLFISFPNDILAQKSKSKQSLVTHPTSVPMPMPDDTTFKSHFRPKLTMQKALKLAEDYIVKEHIDISSYYLFEAHSIEYGSEKGPKETRWYFWWVHEDGADGHYVEITVSMEGVVNRLSSM